VNDVYFACRTCKIYQDAGYRWCYWTLEHPAIVERGTSVAVTAVLNASEYWRGAQDELWLRELLPEVRTFLEQHYTHDLTYGDGEDIGIVPVTDDEYGFLDWMNQDENETIDLVPRYFVERLGYDSWQQVTANIVQLEDKPWWWFVPELRYKAREKFVSLLTD